MAKATSQFVSYVGQCEFHTSLEALAYKVQTLSHTVCRCPRLYGLNFTSVDLANNSPRCTVYQSEDKDEENDKPSAKAGLGVDTIGCVETSYNEHATRQTYPTGNNGGSATPFVCEEESGD